MLPQRDGGLFRGIDCVRLPVSDLESALRFYRDALGHELIWRTDTAAGLRMPEDDAEIVVHTEPTPQESNLLVDSVHDAVNRLTAAGARVVVAPFEIQIGSCAVIADPWDNYLTILDTRKGKLLTDRDGNVTGVSDNPGAEQ